MYMRVALTSLFLLTLTSGCEFMRQASTSVTSSEEAETWLERRPTELAALEDATSTEMKQGVD
jgi:hypothetical protein